MHNEGGADNLFRRNSNPVKEEQKPSEGIADTNCRRRHPVQEDQTSIAREDTQCRKSFNTE